MDSTEDLSALRIERAPRRASRRWVRWVVLLVLLAGAGGTAWTWMTRERPVEVEVASVTTRRAGAQASVLNASGYVTARRRATVSSKVTGKIVEVNVEEGMAVREGQVLARLDDANVQRGAAADGSAAGGGAPGHRRNRSAPRGSRAHPQAPRAAADRWPDHRRRSGPGSLRGAVARGPHRGLPRAGDGGRAAGRPPADGTGQHGDPRTVQRRGALEGRAAGRDGLARLGGWRVHPHRHLDHRGHEVARNRGGRQRELHQPRRVRTARHGAAGRVSRLADSGPRDHHRADGGSTESDGVGPHRLRPAGSANSARHGRQGHLPPRGRRRRGRARADRPRAQSGGPHVGRNQPRVRGARAMPSSGARFKPPGPMATGSKCQPGCRPATGS